MLDSLLKVHMPVEQSEGCALSFPLCLRRVWQRTDGELALQYIDGDGQIVPGQWHSNPEQVRAWYIKLDRLTGRAALALAGNNLIVLQPGGADLKLPVLERLLAIPGAQLMTHRPGRRAVVKYDDETGHHYAKALRPSKAGSVIAACRFVSNLDGRSFGVGEIDSEDASVGLLVTCELAGRNLHDLAKSDPSAFVSGCARAGAALRSLHVAPPPWIREHAVSAEVAMLRARVAGIRQLTPGLYDAAYAALGRTVNALQSGSSQRVLIHRDFYDKQIVLKDDSIGLLDFDTICSGEAALDLANMLGHLELRVLQGGCSPRTMRKAAHSFLDSYGPDTETELRIKAFQDATRTRLAMLYALRPKWAHLAPKILEMVGTDPSSASSDQVDMRAPKRAARTSAPCPFVFVVGCPRSGTTMLERMLSAHRDVAMTHETHWVTKYASRGRTITQDGDVNEGTLDIMYSNKRFARMAPPRLQVERELAQGPMKYRRFVRSVFDYFREREGKTYVGDKSTGGHARDLSKLRKVCPRTKILHLIRDGRDVCLSMLSWPKAHRAAGRFEMFAEDPVATTAAWWKWHVQAAQSQGRALSQGTYLEMSYEALVRDPEGECAALCEFLGIARDSCMARFHAGRSTPGEGKSANAAWLPPTPGIRDWRTQLSDEQIELFEAIAGEALASLGYERRFPSVSARVAERAAERMSRWELELNKVKQPVSRPGITVAAGPRSTEGVV